MIVSTYIISAQTATWKKAHWLVAQARVSFMWCPTASTTSLFNSNRGATITCTRTPRTHGHTQESRGHGFADLRQFIVALERSGGNADELKVELAQKIAVPITCIIIALFGAPLATSTQREAPPTASPSASRLLYTF